MDLRLSTKKASSCVMMTDDNDDELNDKKSFCPIDSLYMNTSEAHLPIIEPEM